MNQSKQLSAWTIERFMANVDRHLDTLLPPPEPGPAPVREPLHMPIREALIEPTVQGTYLCDPPTPPGPSSGRMRRG